MTWTLLVEWLHVLGPVIVWAAIYVATSSGASR